VFTWVGNQLTTFRSSTPANKNINGTSVMMKMRAPRNLSRNVESDENKEQPVISLISLRDFLARVLCFTKTIIALEVIVNNRAVFEVTKDVTPGCAISPGSVCEIPNFFHVEDILESHLNISLQMKQSLPPVLRNREQKYSISFRAFTTAVSVTLVVQLY
jgi:hypothetical protein